MKKLIAWLLTISFLGQTFTAEIIQANSNHIFINNEVTVFQKNLIESHAFSFGRESFNVTVPQQPSNISDNVINENCLQFADQMITSSNANIDFEFDLSCTNSGGREKRIAPVVFLGGAVLIFAIAGLFAKNYLDLKAMKKELDEAKNALELLKKLNQDEATLTSYKFEIQNYIQPHQSAATDIIKKFASGRTIAVDEIPDFLVKYFDLKIGKNKFVFLKMEQCNAVGLQKYVVKLLEQHKDNKASTQKPSMFL
uniref:Uncharacterized protein n=1 Tax=Panagrolaimus sp. PS1159 TaxID=55785 RepID=A0AC35GC54_9BILA